MLPTQFIPEYYSDSKDILFAEDAVEDRQEERAPRPSLLARIFGRSRRSSRQKEESAESGRGRLAHR